MGRFDCICITIGDLIIKRGWVGIPNTGLTLPHFCACPMPGPRIPTSYVVVFFIFNDLRWEMIVVLLILVDLLHITV